MNIEKLNSLANTDFTHFIQSENNVKYKIIIPFLQAFNHLELDLEHAAQGSRIDINIGNRIIVETKALGININNHVQQLSDYSGKELPVLAILTNGRHFRIYSPQWRHRRTFAEKVIYEFELKDLTDLQLLHRLEKIIGFCNYDNDEFFEHVEQREKEIMQVMKEIERIKSDKEVQVIELQNEINELKEKLLDISDQLKSKEQIVSDINDGKIPDIAIKKAETYFPINITLSIPISTNVPIITKIPTTQPPKLLNDNVGDTFKIENKNGSHAIGKLLSNGNFIILKGSLVSLTTAPKFQTSSPSAFRKRTQFFKDGTIDANRQFTKDVEFNSKSGAASVVLGDSADGNKQWRPS